MYNPKPERTYPLGAATYLLVGRKPTAVLFGEERVDVKTWREVYGVVLGRCNENPQHHERLMYLRGKTSGKVRVFLSDSPAGMTRPIQIDENMYGETHYGSATLIHILCKRILDYTGFDYCNISVVLK